MKPLVDLTMTIYSGMPVYTGHPPTMIRPVKNIPEDGRNVSALEMSCHSGTHMDAPLHFIDRVMDVTQIDEQLLVGPCCVGFALQHPLRMLWRTGWYKNYGHENFYSDAPYLTEDQANGIVRRGVRLLLMDCPSPDKEGEDKIHKILLGAGVYLVEYLTNTDALGDASECEIFVGALKIAGADGAPCRVLARPL